MSQGQKQKSNEAARSAVGVHFTALGWDDYSHWKDSDQTISKSIDSLINQCLRTPFKGIGKPEPLTGDLTGYWSRRITKEHRFVYFYEGGVLTVIACRHHY
ncbi:Txe/YoeB family addiction module toxin [Pseudomonas cannabina]|uniref:Putative mRNA interferase YoeB n=3 Tax=Pseudomonas syringae group TaxID=136849 RepID=A0A3M3R5M8_PSECA|nr:MULTISPECIES: Txe/YoeB family addiction module toxin [Pseudomonas syringae group]KPW16167.1 Addiction module toxin Txe [Pseudomonas cannabina pv. alisalensis]MBM0137703.1 Txe/YoeB family addiction module toxin [Pseudomonas cannabina pv. alisalensis]QHE95317.1 Txe/YoeB family addiction module toxin [Pseudomonas syringae pv. maculicola str. ES4326]QQN22287.1 Txe/YoeB family addiction module toxin [Pseudomonas cannabina pv. alisalensis]RMN75950.1 Addiction module toxin Txe [Pseudomonas cannabi